MLASAVPSLFDWKRVDVAKSKKSALAKTGSVYLPIEQSLERGFTACQTH